MEVADLGTARVLCGDTLHAFDMKEGELIRLTLLGVAGREVMYKVHGSGVDNQSSWWYLRGRYAMFTTHYEAENRQHEQHRQTVIIG